MPTSCAVHVHQRAAAVAVVDRGVGLDRGVGRGVAVLVARHLDRPVEGAHDAAGDRRVEAVRRADRHDLLTHVEVAGLPERHGRQPGHVVGLHQRGVGERVGADHRRPVVVVPSANDTVTSAVSGSAVPARVTTWSLVRIRPSSVSTTPEPLPPVPPAGHVEGDHGGEHLVGDLLDAAVRGVAVVGGVGDLERRGRRTAAVAGCTVVIQRGPQRRAAQSRTAADHQRAGQHRSCEPTATRTRSSLGRRRCTRGRRQRLVRRRCGDRHAASVLSLPVKELRRSLRFPLRSGPRSRWKAGVSMRQRPTVLPQPVALRPGARALPSTAPAARA